MDKNTPMIWNGQGPVQIGIHDPINGNADSGYLTNLYRVGCGNSALTTTLSRDTKVIQESCSGQRLTLAELETGKTMTVSLAMYQFSARTLAAALFGEAIEVAGGSVTSEMLPALEPGDYFNLRHVNASDIVVNDSTAGAPVTYVEGEHYVVEDAGHGRCQLIAHPTAHVEPVMVDYTYGGYTNIAAFRRANVERGIIFNGQNQFGQRARLIIPRISLAMDGDFGWLTAEESTLTLGGNVLYVPQLDSDDEYSGFARVSLFEPTP